MVAEQRSKSHQQQVPSKDHGLGDALIGVTERVLSFLSVGDLMAYFTSYVPKEQPTQPPAAGSAAKPKQHKKRPHKKPQQLQQRAPEKTGQEDDDVEQQQGAIASPNAASDDAASIPEEDIWLDENDVVDDCDNVDDIDYTTQTPLTTPQNGSCEGSSEHNGGLIGSIVWITVQPSVIAFHIAKGGVTAILDRLPVLSLFHVSTVHLSLYMDTYYVEQCVPVVVMMICSKAVSLMHQQCVVHTTYGWNIAAYLANLPIRAGQHIVSSLLCVIEATLLIAGSDISGTESRFGYGFGIGGSSSFGFVPADRDPVLLRQQTELRTKLDRINRTASLISYQELKGGPRTMHLSRSRAERVKRMMHYDIPLRPFQATVMVDTHSISPIDNMHGSSGGGLSPISEPFMCTPQSFPPTPISRACVMSRSTQFADDVLFLARDHLRLDEHSKCNDETTRLTAEFLKRQARLAVLNGHGAADGIVLTCGHHCATKIGTALYSSVRAMVPVLRNRYVFFQFSVTANDSVVASLSVGLSTPEMPVNTLVGTWSHSIGLCSTGQVLLSSRWYSCPPGYGAFGVGSTIGVLVFLDGANAFQSWDGELVNAKVTFSVDGRPVDMGVQQQPQQHMQQHVPQQQQQLTNAATITTANTAIGASASSAIGGQNTRQPQQQQTAVIQSSFGGVSSISPCAVALPKDGDLFPTLTLHSPNTQVFCRFCSADLICATRQAIGAPPNVPVYALDGSIVLARGQP
eukprot:15346-Heterococcus_DN1.PRE.1